MGTVLPVSCDVPRVVLDEVAILALVVPMPILVAREVVPTKEVVVLAREVVPAKEVVLTAREVGPTKEVVLLIRVVRVVRVVRGLVLSIRMVCMVRVVNPERVGIFHVLVADRVVLVRTLVLKRLVDRTVGPIGVGGTASIP